MLILFECSITLNNASLTKSLRGLVVLSFGRLIFFPLNFPEIILIDQQLYDLYLFYKNHFPNSILLEDLRLYLWQI